MLNIKEIALEAGHSTVPAYWLSDEKPIACSTSNFEKLVAFAGALIAELAKQNEPVAFANEELDWKGWKSECVVKLTRKRQSKYGFTIPIYTLYTIPPTAEQIANETAEAIAAYITSGRYMVLNPGVLISAEQHTQYLKNHDIYQANAIRRGAWKEFKK